MEQFERFVVDGAFIERCNGNIPHAEIIYRLHYLENIMEKYKCFTPQDLDQRIAELEEENKNLKLCRCKECQSENEFMLQNTIRDLEEENAKLQEQLKKAIVPKFNKNEKVFYIFKGKHVFPGEVVMFDYYSEKYYILSKCFGFKVEWNLVFSTEAEAQEYLEKKK